MASWCSAASAMTLREYLQEVENQNQSVKSLRVATDAAGDLKTAGDMELIPVLTAELGYIHDQSPFGQFATLGASDTKTTSYSLGLAKKFSTGTAVNISATTYEIENTGISIPQFTQFSKFGVGSLGVGLSQSLWRDFFGHATRLRWDRQDVATEATVGRYDLQRKMLLVGAETAYWDYIYAKENLKISQDSLARAQRIESWTRRRVNDGISERADLLSSQALVAARRLQLISAEDDMAAAKRSLRDYLELRTEDTLPDMSESIMHDRALLSMVEGGKAGRVVALDAYLASLDAKTRSLEAQETEDTLRPDLILSGSYNTNSFEEDMAEATKHWVDTDRPTAKVALKWVYPFDLAPKSAAREAARKGALVAKMQSERKALESESAWIELNRRYSEMSKRMQAAEEISRLQTAAAKAQTDLFNKGRSITANVINAEEDAGNAELTLTKLRAEQRKMEAQARLFVIVEEK
ncbi:MAG: TolC family protein [Bdellovibrio sp.]